MMSNNENDERDLNILSMGEPRPSATGKYRYSCSWVEDGGGPRGLSSLILLDETMDRFQHSHGLDEPPDLQEHFDLMAGTGMGA